MRFYSTYSETNTIQIASYNWHSGTNKTKKEFQIIKDTLVVKTLNSPQASERIEKYYKRKLTIKELMHKPDW